MFSENEYTAWQQSWRQHEVFAVLDASGERFFEGSTRGLGGAKIESIALIHTSKCYFLNSQHQLLEVRVCEDRNLEQNADGSLKVSPYPDAPHSMEQRFIEGYVRSYLAAP